MTSEQLAELNRTLQALAEHARLQGCHITPLVSTSPTRISRHEGKEVTVALVIYSAVGKPTCRATVEVAGNDRNEIISKLRKELDQMRAKLSALIGPPLTSSRCPARESGGYQCRLPEGHEGRHFAEEDDGQGR